MKPERILSDFENALEQLDYALSVPAEIDLIKAGSIQYFEFCFELAWKSIKVLSMRFGVECHSPRSCLKTAFQQGWLDDELLWLEMLDARNRMAHTYHAEDALVVYDRLPSFLKAMQALHVRLRSALNSSYPST